jgi:nitroreductase
MDPEQRERLKATAQRAYGGLAPEAREAFGATQGGIALGYLLLTAASMGFGTSPMLGFEPDKVKAVLDLPEHVRIPALIAIGRPGENGRPRHRHALQRIVTFR